MKPIIIAAMLLVLSGCSNYQMISEGERFKFPDGVEVHVITYRDDVNPLTDDVVITILKECHEGNGDHNILPGTKKHDGKTHCGPSKTTVGIIPGIVRSIFSFGGYFTRHSGKPYYEGDKGGNTNITQGADYKNSTSSNARSGTKANAKARSAPPRSKPAKKHHPKKGYKNGHAR